MSTRFTKKKFSGKKITPTGFVAYRIVDGKIVEGWEESKGKKIKLYPNNNNF
jgi:predicted SnoaL-like aldol condensation-catalyzing enzyme